MPARQPSKDENPGFPFVTAAFLHAQLWWLWSIVCTICTLIATKPVDVQQSIVGAPPPRRAVSLCETARPTSNKVTQLRRRPRGYSAPLPADNPIVANAVRQQHRRLRGTTFSEGSSTSNDEPQSRRRRLINSLSRHLRHSRVQGLSDTEIDARPSTLDERTGTTCPPQWWQKTRFYLDTLKHPPPPSEPSSSSRSSLVSDAHVEQETVVSESSSASTPKTLVAQEEQEGGVVNVVDSAVSLDGDTLNSVEQLKVLAVQQQQQREQEIIHNAKRKRKKTISFSTLKRVEVIRPRSTSLSLPWKKKSSCK
ncbi:hypothetical protein VTP01DRAFT_1895 [Rhizomucor pusillus]|uniref:uncharacterized protein n=1 Tax=Rhizomucor pusillus TaxID=4840 RepID=UPI0037427A66